MARCEASRANCLTGYVRRSSPDFILTHADRETFTPQEQKIDLTVHSQLTDEQLNKLINSKIGKVGVVTTTSGEGTTDSGKSTEVRETTR